MKQRIHYHPATERRIVHGVLWFALACIALIVFTSCSPYAVSSFTAENLKATPTITATITATQTATPAPLTCIVSAASVYLRDGAGMIHAAIDVLHKGERLQVIGGGDWLNVQTLEGIKGFIYGKYCH